MNLRFGGYTNLQLYMPTKFYYFCITVWWFDNYIVHNNLIPLTHICSSIIISKTPFSQIIQWRQTHYNNSMHINLLSYSIWHSVIIACCLLNTKNWFQHIRLITRIFLYINFLLLFMVNTSYSITFISLVSKYDIWKSNWLTV